MKKRCVESSSTACRFVRTAVAACFFSVHELVASDLIELTHSNMHDDYSWMNGEQQKKSPAEA